MSCKVNCVLLPAPEFLATNMQCTGNKSEGHAMLSAGAALLDADAGVAQVDEEMALSE